MALKLNPALQHLPPQLDASPWADDGRYQMHLHLQCTGLASLLKSAKWRLVCHACQHRPILDLCRNSHAFSGHCMVKLDKREQGMMLLCYTSASVSAQPHMYASEQKTDLTARLLPGHRLGPNDGQLTCSVSIRPWLRLWTAPSASLAHHIHSCSQQLPCILSTMFTRMRCICCGSALAQAAAGDGPASRLP